jgi:hypothetical protein
MDKHSRLLYSKASPRQSVTVLSKITKELPLSGISKVQSGYHSELARIAGIITAVEMLCSRFSLTKGAIKIGLDGLEALNQSHGDWPLSPTQADFDMLTNIRSQLASSKITWHWHCWRQGHQYKHKPLRFLDFWPKKQRLYGSNGKSIYGPGHLARYKFRKLSLCK